MAGRIQLRRGTAANWTSANPTLASGEVGVETDTGKMKVGDGATLWASLGYTDAGAVDHIADTSDAHDASAISAPSGVIIPPIAASLASSSAAGWFLANSNTGVRFSLDRNATPSQVIIPCTTASGNIEVSIHKLMRSGVNSVEYTAVKVATSGIIACPTPSSNRIFVGFTETVTLNPGQYALMLWCDNITASFHHNLATAMQYTAQNVSFSGTSVTATPESGLVYNGGRGFLAIIEEAGNVLGDVVLFGDSLSTTTYRWFEVAKALAGRDYTQTYKGNAGEETAAIAARVAADVVALTPDYCVVLAGTNDIGSTETAEQIQANLTTIYDACNAAGIDVIACTIPPRDGVALGTALSDARYVILDAVNTWIRARTDVVAVCDWTVELSTGDGRRASSTYFTDQVHPNAAGVKLMGQIMATTLRTL